jgi:hypothetical protein
MIVINHPLSKTKNKKIIKGRKLEDAVFGAIVQLGETKYKGKIVYLENAVEGKKMVDCFFITNDPPLIFIVECKNWDPNKWKTRDTYTRASLYKKNLYDLIKDKFNLIKDKFGQDKFDQDKFDLSTNSYLYKRLDIDPIDFKNEFGISKDCFFDDSGLNIDRVIPFLVLTGYIPKEAPLYEIRYNESNKKIIIDINTSGRSNVAKEAVRKVNRNQLKGNKIGICNINIGSDSIDEVNTESIDQVAHKLDISLAKIFEAFEKSKIIK